MRLVVIVEGNTEVQFVQQLLTPFLYEKGFVGSIEAYTIVTSKSKNAKGGVINYEYYKNTVNNTFAQGNVFITSLIDFYKLPTNFPNFSLDKNDVSKIEQGIKEDFGNRLDFLPYIQLHEIESLFFSDINGFEMCTNDTEQLEQIKSIIHAFATPEDINNSYETAPSKRLTKIMNYEKNVDVEFILPALSVDKISSKCPRFSQWIQELLSSLGLS